MSYKNGALQINKLSLCKLIESLSNGGTLKEICAETGLQERATGDWIRAFRHYGLVFINGYERDSKGNPSILVYKWCGPNAVGVRDRAKPPRKSRSDIAKDYRKRKNLGKNLGLLYMHPMPSKEQ